MNVLKKFKVVFLSVLALMFTLTAVSCNNNKAPERTGITDDDESFTTAKANVSEDGFNFDTAILSSIDIDVSKARTTFFLGESFSSEGVVVKANFLASVDGERKSESFTTTDFSIDTSEVDMYNIGTYPVEVTYRYKAIVNKKTYNVNVISSELAASGEEYVGGIDVKYNGELECEIKLNQAFNPAMDQFTIIEHDFVGYEEVKSKSVAISKYSTDGSTPVKIDASAVNSAVRGDYVVKVEYTPDEVVVDGKTLNYKVKAFIIVHVTDKVVGFRFENGPTTFAATVGEFDYSEWNFRITREISGEAIVKYNEKDFTVSNIVPFVTGTQEAKIEYFDTSIPVRMEIVITESETHNITIGNIFPDEKDAEENPIYDYSKVWKFTTNYKNLTDEPLDDSGVFKINKPTGADKRDQSGKGKPNDSYNGIISFGPRYTVKGNDSYISVTMDNPGMLVVYAGCGADEQRDVTVFDAPNSGNEIGTEYTGGVKGTVYQYFFNIEKAGTYYIQSFEGGIYVHGVVVAVAK